MLYIQTGGSQSVTYLLIGPEDFGAQAFCQAGPGSVCIRLQGTAKRSIILFGVLCYADRLSQCWQTVLSQQRDFK